MKYFIINDYVYGDVKVFLTTELNEVREAFFQNWTNSGR